MTHDSTLPAPTIDPPRTARAAVLLNRLILRAERDQDLAFLLTAVYWTISPIGPWALSGTLYRHSLPSSHGEVGERLLGLAADLFGGTPEADGEWYDPEHAWHQLEFTYSRQQVMLRATVPAESTESRLRKRIAELEASVAAVSAVNQ
ncbi:MAG: hypothetical protein HOZ81_23660 [Streptomyces sp.]|nr:hypothetical protein [Streptomyces sp.]